jgi:transcriptional regulator with XRE-family HTH domain
MQARTWLSEMRKKQGLSRREVCEQAGVERSLYAYIELGKRNPSVRTAQKIAEVLGFKWYLFF